MLNKYLVTVFLTSITVSVLHIAALSQEYYWTLWWYDVMMHFLGGMVIASIYVWLSKSFPKLNLGVSFWKMTLFIILVGFVWEAWEVFTGMTGFREINYVSDTTYDFINDILGTLAVFFIHREK
jgi:glycopeptide antibiotics resistance protein